MPWIEACQTDEIDEEDVVRWDHGDKTYAIYHGADGQFYCTDGLCSHEQVHLADGLVMDFEIECPKHNGLFDYRSGAALRAPACDALSTYEVRVDGSSISVLLP